MDSVQFTIIVISLVLTILVVVLGIQVWQILKEFRISIMKVNAMLDDMKKVTSTVGDTVTGFSETISGFRESLTGFKTAMSFVNLFRRKKTEERETV